MKKIIFTFLAISLICQSIESGEFKKISWRDPYDILRQFDNPSLYDASSYYGQLDSFGINISRSWADSISTNNSYGIMILGQDTSVKIDDLRSGASGWVELFTSLAAAHNVYAELEKNEGDSLLGFVWNKQIGDVYLENESPVGHICRSGIDTAGVAINLTGQKISHKKSCRVNYFDPSSCYTTYFRTYVTMMCWDNTTTDTLCKISTIYKDINNTFQSHDEYIIGTDFDSTEVWKTISKSRYRPGKF